MSFPYHLSQHQPICDWLIKKTLESIEKRIVSGKKVRIGDLGGGNGLLFSSVLGPLLFRIKEDIPTDVELYNIDIHPDQKRAELLKRTFQIPIISKKADLTKEIPIDHNLDLAFVNFVYSYLGPKRDEFLKKLNQKIKDDGRVVFLFHTKKSPVFEAFNTTRSEVDVAMENLKKKLEQKEREGFVLSEEIKRKLEDIKELYEMHNRIEHSFDPIDSMDHAKEIISKAGLEMVEEPRYFDMHVNLQHRLPKDGNLSTRNKPDLKKDAIVAIFAKKKGIRREA